MADAKTQLDRGVILAFFYGVDGLTGHTDRFGQRTLGQAFFRPGRTQLQIFWHGNTSFLLPVRSRSFVPQE